MSLKVIESGTIGLLVSYYCPIVTLSVRGTVFEIFDFKITVILKIGLAVLQVIENVTIR